MKHSNQEDVSRNQGTTADQNKKTKGQNDSTNQHGQTGRGSQDHSNMGQRDTANRQKDKQGNKK